MNDLEAINRVLAGDRDAFAWLVKAHHAACLAYAHRLLGTREDAEDVVQEVFIRAYRALPRYQDQGRFRAWLFTILVNRCRTILVQRQRRTDRTQPMSEAIVETVGGPDAEVDPFQEARLREALDHLDASQREALLLKYGEDMSYPEIARCTGDSVSALKMRVKRARETLVAVLKETLLV